MPCPRHEGKGLVLVRFGNPTIRRGDSGDGRPISPLARASVQTQYSIAAQGATKSTPRRFAAITIARRSIRGSKTPPFVAGAVSQAWTLDQVQGFGLEIDDIRVALFPREIQTPRNNGTR